MHCSSCVSKIRNALEKKSDISDLKFNAVQRKVFITHDQVAVPEILDHIEEAGFHPQLDSHNPIETDDDRLLTKRLGIAGLAMMQVMMIHIALYAGAFSEMDALIERMLELTALTFCIPVVSFSAIPFFSRALAFRRVGITAETPIALAIAIAFGVSLTATLTGNGEVYYDSIVMFTFLMLGARYVDRRLRHKLTVQDSLVNLLPKEVVRIHEGKRTSVPIEEVESGDTLWIEQGAQLPADGTLTSENAKIDEALLTGEEHWCTKTRGDALYAGTFNGGHAFELCVLATGPDTRLAAIDKLADDTALHRGKSVQLADRIARVFIPAIVVLAGVTWGVWHMVEPGTALSAMLAVLVVSCPCALSLATPAALTAALVDLRRRGLLVRDSNAIERAPDVRDVFFDKTGTLTQPVLEITGVHTLPGFDAEACHNIASALQIHSRHPLAKPFHRAETTSVDHLTIEQDCVRGNVGGFHAVIGSATATGFDEPADTTDKLVYLAIDDRPAAVFSLSAPLRNDAEITVKQFKESGCSVHLLSGDTDSQCQSVAQTLDMDWQASMEPEDKPVAVAKSQGPALFIGDGLNDLPALAGADISVATLETSDLVKSRASVVLISARLGSAVELIRTSLRTRRIVCQNLLWALAYNALAIPAAALGYAPPWLAALGMSASSLLVLANATRVIQPVQSTQSTKKGEVH